MFSNLLRHPLKNYFKIAGIASGLTLTSNVIYTSTFPDPPFPFSTDAESYTSILLLKSLYMGLTWPIIPYRVVVCPKNFFTVGGGISEYTSEFYNEVIKDSPIGKNEIKIVDKNADDKESLEKAVKLLDKAFLKDYNKSIIKSLEWETTKVIVNGENRKDDIIKIIDERITTELD